MLTRFPILPKLSRWRCACMAHENRSQCLLHLVARKPAAPRGRGIRRKPYPSRSLRSQSRRSSTPRRQQHSGAKSAGEARAEFSRSPYSARNRGDVLQRDRTYHRHSCRHRDVKLVAWAGPPSSSSDKPYKRRHAARFTANISCELRARARIGNIRNSPTSGLAFVPE